MRINTKDSENKNVHLHSAKMQIHVNRKAKLLWMTPHCGPIVMRSVTEFSRFHLIAHYVSGVNFSQRIIFCVTRRILA